MAAYGCCVGGYTASRSSAWESREAASSAAAGGLAAASFWSSIAFTDRALKLSLSSSLFPGGGSGMPFVHLLEQAGQVQVKK